jgi:hypothetical protein
VGQHVFKEFKEDRPEKLILAPTKSSLAVNTRIFINSVEKPVKPALSPLKFNKIAKLSDLSISPKKLIKSSIKSDKIIILNNKDNGVFTRPFSSKIKNEKKESDVLLPNISPNSKRPSLNNIKNNKNIILNLANNITTSLRDSIQNENLKFYTKHKMILKEG